MRINLEDSKGQIITSYEIQEDDTLENIDGFYEVKGGKMKHQCPKGAFSEGGILWAICEDCMQKEDELDAQETYERNVQDCMDYQFQDEEAATYRNES